MAEKQVDQQAGDEATQIGIVEGSVTIIHNYYPPDLPASATPEPEAPFADDIIPDNPYQGLFGNAAKVTL